MGQWFLYQVVLGILHCYGTSNAAVICGVAKMLSVSVIVVCCFG